MRTLKFRAWDKTDGFMLNDFYIDGYLAESGLIDLNEALVAVQKDWELMEYTGLKDKNGTEIYEGDIVKLKEWIGTVVYREDCTRFQVASTKEGISGFVLTTNLSNSEVIGNIYESPHLLDSNSKL